MHPERSTLLKIEGAHLRGLLEGFCKLSRVHRCPRWRVIVTGVFWPEEALSPPHLVLIPGCCELS